MPNLLPGAAELAQNLDANIREKLNEHKCLLAGQTFLDLSFSLQIKYRYLTVLISNLSFQYFSIVKDDDTYEQKAIDACKVALQYDVTKKNIITQLEAAAENGPAWLQMFLSKCYLEGSGIEIDKRQSFYWCQCAANQGSTYAHYALGWMYAYAHGVEKNNEKKMEHYLIAAKNDYNAQYELGQIYEYGEGVVKDLHEACVWYRLAAEKGHSLSSRRLIKLERFLINLQLYQCLKAQIDSQLEVLKDQPSSFWTGSCENKITKIKQSLDLLYRSLKENSFSNLDEMLNFVIKTERTYYAEDEYGDLQPRTVVYYTLSVREALNISRDNLFNFAGSTMGPLFSNTNELEEVVHAIEKFNTSSSALSISRFGLMPAREVFFEPGEWIEMQTMSSPTG